MEAFGGFEPQVGEIRALRTFRIGPGGVLYPLFVDRAWTPGTNTSLCRLPQPTGQHLTWRAPHPAPDPDCGCGFYAYADDTSAGEYPHSRHVLAVIACWGQVIAGTRGVRSQHARIEALWISPKVPNELKAAVTAHYPDLSVYGTKTAMLNQLPGSRRMPGTRRSSTSNAARRPAPLRQSSLDSACRGRTSNTSVIAH